ncbi:chitin synthase 1 [Nematolebias whitei]|uniref:chitin synthase 1 n=1 Tax=Nematolebias whitei TaxID=451745 RepID=UPI00189BF73B|nr:chitin synthase 1 [Nematolebias whitei]
MEELKYRGKKREVRHRDTWDPFQLNPVGAEKEQKRRCFVVAQYLVAVIVGVAVLASAVVAKGSLLMLSTLSSPHSLRTSKEKQFYKLMLVFCLVCPNFLVFMKSLWRCTFKSFVQPNMRTMALICVIECLVSLGTSVLVLVVMPQFDILTNLFISGGVCIVSAILQIIFRLQRETWKIIFPICSLILTSAGYCLLGMDYYVRISTYVDQECENCFVYVGIGIFSSLLVSLCWWENTMQATHKMQDTLSELEGFRDFVFVISSILRILVIGAVYLIYDVLIKRSFENEYSKDKSIVWSDFNLQDDDWELLQIGLVLLFLQAFCAAACHWFGVVACKIHAVRMSFAIPLCCTGPTVLGCPMVWYQKFEYAVGHWLQKTAEHVFGSVLCSPGCFSLFRGSALMDDNILKRYTTTATKGAQYVQYDQGEDRWLCTLLLQQGWRVEYNAASDAYTNSPQEFKEFYNQRRRWGPSTLANTLDLLHSGKETVKRNSSISRLYIFYQMFTVGSSILGPASVTLMIAGAFQFILKMAGTLSIIIACIPPVFYIIICFVTKANTQITIAAIMSVLYAFLMTASFFSIIGDMVVQGTFLTPTGVFLVSMAIMYMVTAILHPEEMGLIIYGLMYFICIPSGYLLLTIYSLVNMNNVSWGTRESNKGVGEDKKSQSVLCKKDCKLCCWDMKIQVTQETDNVMLQQITTMTQQTLPLLPGKKEKPLQAASKAEPKTKEKDLESKNHLADKNKEEGSISSDAATTDSGIVEKKSPLTNLSDDEDDRDNYCGDLEEEEVTVKEWVEPVKQEFLKKLTYFNMKRNLQAQIRYTLRNKIYDDVCEELVLMLTDSLNTELRDVGPEDILDQPRLEMLQDELTKQARHILKNNRLPKLEKRVKVAIEKTLAGPQVRRIDEEEKDFWTKLIERYLTPIKDTDEHKAQVDKELKSLRNKAVFLYFIINVLWVVATFFLQAIGNDVISIKIPKFTADGNHTGEYLKVEPLSLMFLLSFAILLLVQFLAMLYHRVYTLIHVVSYRGTEKDYKERAEDQNEEEDLTMENQYTLSITTEDL